MFLFISETSSAVLLGVRVLQLYSDFSENLDRLAILLGQIFQLWNDFVNLKSDKVNVKYFYSTTIFSPYCSKLKPKAIVKTLAKENLIFLLFMPFRPIQMTIKL
jgi:hypothetical protein